MKLVYEGRITQVSYGSDGVTGGILTGSLELLVDSTGERLRIPCSYEHAIEVRKTINHKTAPVVRFTIETVKP